MISLKKAWSKIFIHNKLSSISLCVVLLFACIFYLILCSNGYNVVTSYSDYESNYGDYFISSKKMNYEEVSTLIEGIANSRIPVQGYAYNQHIGFCNDEYGYKIAVNEIGGNLDLIFSRNLVAGHMPLNYSEGLITKDYLDKVGSNINIGDEITINLYSDEETASQKVTFKVVGILEHYYTDSDLNFLLGPNTENDNHVERSFDCYLYSKDYSTVMKSILMNLSGADSYDTIRRVLAYIFNVNDVTDLTYIGVEIEYNRMFVIASMDVSSSFVLFLIGIIVFIAFSIILFLIINIIVRLSLNDRLSDLGIMSSLGLSIKRIRKALLIESVVLSSFCILVALPIALKFNKIINKRIEPLIPTRYLKNELNIGVVISCYVIVFLSISIQYLLAYKKTIKATSKELINGDYKISRSRKSEVFGKYGLIKLVIVNNMTSFKQTVNLFILSVAAVLICLIAISFGYSMKITQKELTEDYLELGDVNTDYAVISINNTDLNRVNDIIKQCDIDDYYTIDGLQLEVNGKNITIDIYSDNLLRDCGFDDSDKPILIWINDDTAIYSEDYPYLTHINKDTELRLEGVNDVLYIDGFLSMYMQYGDSSLICNEAFYNTYLYFVERVNYKSIFYSDLPFMKIHDYLIANGVTSNTVALYPEDHGNYKAIEEVELFVSIALILGICMFVYHIVSLYSIIMEKSMRNSMSNDVMELLGMTRTRVKLMNCSEVVMIVLFADIISLLLSNKITNVVLGNIYSNANQPIILSALLFIVQLFLICVITFNLTNKYESLES